MKLWPSTSKPKRNEAADLALFFFFFNVIKSDCRHHWSSLILQFVEYTHKKLKCRQWLLNYLLSGKTAKKKPKYIFQNTPYCHHMLLLWFLCPAFIWPVQPVTSHRSMAGWLMGRTTAVSHFYNNSSFIIRNAGVWMTAVAGIWFDWPTVTAVWTF